MISLGRIMFWLGTSCFVWEHYDLFGAHHVLVRDIMFCSGTPCFILETYRLGTSCSGVCTSCICGGISQSVSQCFILRLFTAR